jgi:hypothetical protein
MGGEGDRAEATSSSGSAAEATSAGGEHRETLGAEEPGLRLGIDDAGDFAPGIRIGTQASDCTPSSQT